MTYIREKFPETHLQLPFGCSRPQAANGDLVARQDLHLRLEVISLSYCPLLLPRHKLANTNGPGGRS